MSKQKTATRKKSTKPAKASHPTRPTKATKLAQGNKATKATKYTDANKSTAVDLESASQDVFGLPLTTWVESCRKTQGSEARSGRRGFLFAVGNRNIKTLKSLIKGHLVKWQVEMCLSSEAEMQHFHGQQGPVWILRLPEVSLAPEGGSQTTQVNQINQTNQTTQTNQTNKIQKSTYARLRDLAGAVVPQLSPFGLEKLILEFHDLVVEDQCAVLMGLELGSYSYSENRSHPRKNKKKLPRLLLRTVNTQLATQVAKQMTTQLRTEPRTELTTADIKSTSRLALAVNLARHFVNLPGGTLNPRTFSEAVANLFMETESTQVEVWHGEKLAEERMNLLLAVGGGAAEGPRLVHLRYRPKNVRPDQKPIAIVGKGITFDSGGLDIKPSSAMRLMKKDMGGAASAVAIAYWADATQLQMPLDIYLSLAENAVSANSFRPGDIITARNGLTIEIHNTDAEGRLVLADALDLAASQEAMDKPEAIINLATLTGAIKVGLGAEIAGLFCNNDHLAHAIESSGVRKGDLCWRMPLYQPYKSLLRSHFADHANASDGFAGAITAALFLEFFVKNTPWAHLDIYAWKDSAGGAFAEAGGNGQSVQALSDVLTQWAAIANEGNTGGQRLLSSQDSE